MNERYLGPKSDRKYIKTYLAKIRKLDLIEIATLIKPINLADINRLAVYVDVDKFQSLARRFIARIDERHGIEVEAVRPKRCQTTLPPESDGFGGFHDCRSLVYQYWYQASFVIMLGRIVSKKLCALELLRDFIHDCVHHSTFRSFRRIVRIPAKSPDDAKHRVPEVYREQYGINFRNEDGLSYSYPKLTARSPETINPQLLMDGLVVLVMAVVLQTEIGYIECGNALEVEIKKKSFLNLLTQSLKNVLTVFTTR